MYDSLSVALDILKAHPTWYLFPIRRLEKAPPLFKNELELASNDPKTITKWATQFNGPNWGIALKKSKLVVPDVDTKPGKVGQQTLDDLELSYGALPDTLCIRTPSGGYHYYFNEANGVTHQMRVGGFGKDVDSTNYVVAPGCFLSSGGTYEIIRNVPVADTPEWFGELLNKNDDIGVIVDQTPDIALDQQANIDWCTAYLRNDAPPCIQGSNGEYTLLLVAGVLKDRGLSMPKAIELLGEEYNVPGKCEPQWLIGDGPVADRLDIKVRNAWTYLKKSAPGSAAAEAEFGGDNMVDDATMKWIEQDEPVAAQRSAEWRAERKRKADEAEAERAEKQAADEAAEYARQEREVAESEQSDSDFVSPIEADDDLPDAPPESDEQTAPEDPNEPSDADFLPGEPTYDKPKKFNPNLKSLDKINDKTIPVNVDDICQRWVWITALERFVNRVNPTLQWKQAQFDSEFNRYASVASLSKELFKGVKIRRFRELAFRPGSTEFPGFGLYNVWRPGSVVPKEGDTTLWNEHMNYLFQDANDRALVLNWMAWCLQNPTLKPNHALLIVGRATGTGKSFVARVLEKLIGERNTQRPKNSSMGGDFNAWLKDCRLCIIEEVMQTHRRENFNALRDLITEPTVEVNIKGISAFKIDNFVCMLGITNRPDALPLDERDRRWMVVETFAERQEKDYYDKLMALLNSPDALAAIMYELLNRDLGEYSGLTAAPLTLAKEQMIEFARNDAETWLEENANNEVLNRPVVTVQDVKDSMPPELQRVARLVTVIIPNFLRDRLSGKRVANQRLLSDGKTRVRLWTLRNRDQMIPDGQLVAAYEKAKREGNAAADTSAADDFGAAG